HHRRAHVLERGDRPRCRLPGTLKIGEQRVLRGRDLVGGGVGAQDAGGDQQHAAQLRRQFCGVLLRVLPALLPGHSSSPSIPPRRKSMMNMIEIRYMSQWPCRALPRTTLISTYMMKPAPIPTVIE